MPSPIQSILDAGSTLWLDSVDPEEVKKNHARGISGATSNPAIIAALVATGRFDETIKKFMNEGHDDEAIAWAITDKLTQGRRARVLTTTGRSSRGNTGWVSFELDPLLEDPDNGISTADRTKKYVEAGQAVGLGPDQPDDQGARHRGRPGRVWRSWPPRASPST